MTTYQLDGYIREDEVQKPPSRWKRTLTWTTFLVVGFVIWELTKQPALGVAAVCLKFGWDDLRTGMWLQRHDFNRWRGWAGFWIYLASGLWKAAITASIMIIAYAIVEVINRKAGQAPVNQLPREVVGALVTGVCGCALSSVATLIALAVAIIGRVKVWLNSAVHNARRHDIWPPSGWSAGPANRAYLLVVATCNVTIVPVLYLAVVLILARVIGPLRGAGWPVLIIVATLVILYPISGMAIFRLMSSYLDGRVFATSPEECWDRTAIPEKPVEPQPQSILEGRAF